MGELLPYYALFYAFGLLLMALFVRLFWSKKKENDINRICLLYTSPSPRDATLSRMAGSA